MTDRKLAAEEALEECRAEAEITDALWEDDMRKVDRAVTALAELEKAWVNASTDRKGGKRMIEIVRAYFAAEAAREARRKEHDEEFHAAA